MSGGEDETIGLAGYVKRMKDDQKAIYYQIAPSREAIETGPYIEAFKSRGIEVLYLYETIDDYVITAFTSGQTETFPLYIYAAQQRGIPVQVNVIGTIIFVTAISFNVLQKASSRLTLVLCPSMTIAFL